MSQYIQLLGTDTPDAYGGCCYFGPLDHPALVSRAAEEKAGAGKGVSSCSPSPSPGRAPADTGGGSDGYLFFNCPEGSQRFSSEAHIRLNRVRGFFFTRWGAMARPPPDLSDDVLTSPGGTAPSAPVALPNGVGVCSAVMGTPGLLFTINDAGARHATFFGPSTYVNALQAQGKCSHTKWPSTPSGTPPIHAPPALMNGNAHCVGGVEQFLVSLRHHYFTYRSMSFQHLCPVYVPFQLPTSRVTKEGEDPVTLPPPWAPEQCVPTPSIASKTTPFTSRETVYPVVTPWLGPQLPGFVSQPSPSTSAGPFIVLVLQLNPNSLLVAFRVSGSARCPASETSLECPASQSGSAHLYEFAEDQTELVLGYAVVNAPSGSLDAARARQLGVKPGPKYGQLKRGIPVYADEPTDTVPGRMEERATKRHRQALRPSPLTPAVSSPYSVVPAGEKAIARCCADNQKRQRPECVLTEEACVLHRGHAPVAGAVAGALLDSSIASTSDLNELLVSEEVSAPSPRSTPSQSSLRLVCPSDVLRCTTASRHLYISLVLDGDSSEDVHDALQELFGSSHDDGCDAKGNGEESENKGALARLLRCCYPHLLYVDAAADRVRERREFVLRQVVHLQPRRFFHSTENSSQPTAMCEDDSGVYERYIRTVFKCVHCPQMTYKPMVNFTEASPDELLSKAHNSPCAANENKENVCSATTHHLFTCFVQQHFTAFPTALVHRFHLHCLAPQLFPVAERAPANGVLDAGQTTYWPYSYKLRCIPEGAMEWWSPAPAIKEKESSRSQAPGYLPSKNSSTKVGTRAASSRDRSGLLRYPTLASAIGMLSNTFRSTHCPSEFNAEPSVSFNASRHTAQYEEVAADEGGGALVFLGTGSAVPSKYRNVSGTYLELHLPHYCFGRYCETNGGSDHVGRASELSRGIIILDFGEGSVGQLANLLAGRHSNDALSSFVQDLVLIFISHGHADHHLGLISLLSLRHYYISSYQASSGTSSSGVGAPRKLLVVCPVEVYSYLQSTWLQTMPVASWIHAECEFEVIQPSWTSMLPIGVSASYHVGVPPCTDDCLMEFPFTSHAGSLTSGNNSGSGPAVVASLPRLQALCAHWNQCILQRQRESDRTIPPTSWWDAEVFEVDHPSNAHALLIRFPFLSAHSATNGMAPMLSTKVFLFSGDTRPSQLLVQRSRLFCGKPTAHRDGSPSHLDLSNERGDVSLPSCDGTGNDGGNAGIAEGVFICLHEATFGPGYELEALQKKHSTLPEAIAIGAQVGALFVVLNHFSQRYPKLPGLMEEHLGGSQVDLECKRRGPRHDTTVSTASSLSKCAEGSLADTQACSISPCEISAQEGTKTTSSDICAPPPPPYCRRGRNDPCFAFDTMRLPFSALTSGLAAGLMPTFIRLMEEYESWYSGTTQRLRDEHLVLEMMRRGEWAPMTIKRVYCELYSSAQRLAVRQVKVVPDISFSLSATHAMWKSPRASRTSLALPHPAIYWLVLHVSHRHVSSSTFDKAKVRGHRRRGGGGPAPSSATVQGAGAIAVNKPVMRTEVATDASKDSREVKREEDFGAKAAVRKQRRAKEAGHQPTSYPAPGDSMKSNRTAAVKAYEAFVQAPAVDGDDGAASSSNNGATRVFRGKVAAPASKVAREDRPGCRDKSLSEARINAAVAAVAADVDGGAVASNMGRSCLPKGTSSRIQEQVRQKRLLLKRQKEAKQSGASLGPSVELASASPPEASIAAATRDPLFFPDYREKVLLIFQQLAEINLAIGERYKVQSYQAAVERLKRNDTIFSLLPANLRPLRERPAATDEEAETVNDELAKRTFILSPENSLPGVGDKLRKKVIEILKTGDLEELHILEAKPIVRAIRELTQVHGIGPRTSISFYKDYGISSVEELRAYAARLEVGKNKETSTVNGNGSSVAPIVDKAKKGAASSASNMKVKPFHLTDAQRMALKYHSDIIQRMPHAEGRLHEAFLKLRLRKHLGRAYELVICGSYRREEATSGDLDVLITPRPVSSSDETGVNVSKPQQVLNLFVDAMRSERYIEASLAQGPTKFMGVCRLRCYSNDEDRTERYPARRIDIRFVDRVSFPAAMLYFTGSKNFNVVMRARAIKQHLLLNEYGLFRNHSGGQHHGPGSLHDMIGKLARAQYFSSKSTLSGDEDGEQQPADVPVTRGRRKKKETPAMLEELREALRFVEERRVEVKCEKDVFDALGMAYVAPPQRSL